MSADNWAVCPRCLQRSYLAHEELGLLVDASYGVRPVAEYLALRAEHDTGPKPVGNTFREDYETWVGGQDGVTETLSVSYKGVCEVCGARVEHSIEKPFDR